ncbi:MAG: TIGR04283 family arsenosugar biosynthesis glycosyltransferase [Burkholderiales bacterium]|nr:TIGR04283 family arsenosugar biosynthesis glycosyltransferase [Burkholderiales bacterium]
MQRISIVMPALNEAGCIRETLRALVPLRRTGHEAIVVDGGSDDGTRELAAPLADRVLVTRGGRARQMNAGAALARGDVLWFLHADSVPGADAGETILAALAASGRDWGRFDVRLSGRHPLLRIVETMMNLRSRLTGIATGDQGMFVRRACFQAAGGFPDIPLMEDVALSRRLKRGGRPVCVRNRLETSSRRWEARGVLRTILLMWRLRLAFFFGADPHRLADRYQA